MAGLPGVPLVRRNKYLIWLADCSGSMNEDGKIQALNHAIREALPHLKKASDDNTQAELKIGAICFSDSARWHVKPRTISDFAWTELAAKGHTALGAALVLLSKHLKGITEVERVLPPTFILVSDGEATDHYKRGLELLDKQPLWISSERMAIAIGEDANKAQLSEFIGDSSKPVLSANNPDALVKLMTWASKTIHWRGVKRPSPPISSGDTWPAKYNV